MASPHFSDYNRNETVDFLHRFFDRIKEEASKEEYKVKEGFDVVANNITRVLESYLPANEVIASAKLAEKDLKRDGPVVFFRQIVRAFLSFYEMEPRQAAERLTNAMLKYSDRIDKLNYVSETAALSNFCKELTTEPQLVKDVELLNLTKVVLDMQSRNSEFDNLYNERLDLREQHNEVKFSNDLVVAVNSCRSFYNMVQSKADLLQGVDFTLLLNKLSLLADDYNQIADKRIAIAKANKEKGQADTAEE